MMLCDLAYGIRRAVGIQIVGERRLLIRHSLEFRYAEGYLPHQSEHDVTPRIAQWIGCDATCNYQSKSVNRSRSIAPRQRYGQYVDA